MNYYEHHIGDYAAATAHLSLVEDAVYSRLLRRYYLQEGPLVGDVKGVARLAGARTPDELAAVETVLAEFFVLHDDGWHQKRCDADILKYHERQEAGAGKRENEAERQRAHRERRAELFAQLREKGVVPVYNTQTNELVTLLSRVTGDVRHADTTATHTPVTSHQTKEQDQEHVQPPAARRTADRFEEFWAAYPIRKGKADALAKWRSRNLDGIADTILADVTRRKAQDRQWLDGYAPHASTYVNQRGWDDDIETRDTGERHATRTPSRRLSAVEQVEHAIAERKRREYEAENRGVVAG